MGNENEKTLKKMVTIAEEEYNQLIEDSTILNRLDVYGVDNWEGYEDAVNDSQGWAS